MESRGNGNVIIVLPNDDSREGVKEGRGKGGKGERREGVKEGRGKGGKGERREGVKEGRGKGGKG